MSDFSVIIKAVLDKTSAMQSAYEIQNLIKKMPVEFTAKLNSASTLNEVRKVSKEIASELNKKHNLNLNASDVTKAFSSIQAQAKSLDQTLERTAAKIRSLQSGKSLDLKVSNVETQYKKLQQLGTVSKSVTQEMQALKQAQNEFNSLGKNASPDQLSKSYQKLEAQIKRTSNTIKIAKNEMSGITKPVSDLERIKLSTGMEAWLKSNSAATKDFGTQIKALIAECKTADSTRFSQLSKEFQSLKNQAQLAGKTGKNFFDTMTTGIQKFSEWGIASGIVMRVVTTIRGSVDELKEINSILTEISKTSDATASQLKELGNTSFEAASKFGRKASDYLTGVQEMNRSGYYGEQGTAMAELSIMAQSAGDMEADMANSYLLATNAAYQYQGSVEKLNNVLDGQNMINTMVMLYGNI